MIRRLNVLKDHVRCIDGTVETVAERVLLMLLLVVHEAHLTRIIHRGRRRLKLQMKVPAMTIPIDLGPRAPPPHLLHHLLARIVVHAVVRHQTTGSARYVHGVKLHDGSLLLDLGECGLRRFRALVYLGCLLLLGGCGLVLALGPVFRSVDVEVRELGDISPLHFIARRSHQILQTQLINIYGFVNDLVLLLASGNHLRLTLLVQENVHGGPGVH